MRKWAAFPREIRQPSSRVSDTAFDNAFRKSRLNSLPKRERDVPHRQLSRKQKRQAPIDQVITTTSASFYRQDWGLKRPIPWRNTKFVTLEENDTSTGMTDFNPGDKYTMIQNRIRELQRPVSSILAKNKSQPKQLKRDGLFQPLYIEPLETPSRRPSAFSTKTIQSENPHSSASLITNTVSSPLNQLQNSTFSQPSTAHDSLRNPVATAGLCYHLPGTLDNRPMHGRTLNSALYTNKKIPPVSRPEGTIFPGRLIKSDASAANVAGVTASANIVNASITEVQNRQLVYDVVQPFTVQSIEMTKQGAIDMIVRVVAEQKQRYAGSRRRGNAALLSNRKRKSDDDDDLLGLVNDSI